jgi:hypothetical protein
MPNHGEENSDVFQGVHRMEEYVQPISGLGQK